MSAWCSAPRLGRLHGVALLHCPPPSNPHASHWGSDCRFVVAPAIRKADARKLHAVTPMALGSVACGSVLFWSGADVYVTLTRFMPFRYRVFTSIEEAEEFLAAPDPESPHAKAP